MTTAHPVRVTGEQPWVEGAQIFAPEGDIIPISQGFTATFEKAVWTKEQSLHCSQSMQKCDRPVENCLPIGIISF